MESMALRVNEQNKILMNLTLNEINVVYNLLQYKVNLYVQWQ